MNLMAEPKQPRIYLAFITLQCFDTNVTFFHPEGENLTFMQQYVHN